MSDQRSSYHKLSIAVGVCGLAIVLLAGLNVLMSGTPAIGPIVGVVDDWTHHHVVFTNPGTAAEALAEGRFEEWYRVVNEPRYQMQEMKRNPMQRALASAPDFAARMALLRPAEEDSEALSAALPRTTKVTLEKDWNVTLGAGGTVGADNYPAKFTFYSALSCSDIAVFNTSLVGSATQANVMAFDNLYSSLGTCGSTIPSVAWAYNTTTGDKVATSVVFNLTGNQIAFVSTNGTHAYLNVLYFQSEGTAYNLPVSPHATTASGSTYAACRGGSTSCLFRAEFNDDDNDTTSSPYYDYNSDTLWVGDASGKVHKFTGVFNASPGEVTSGGWPATTAATALTSPVFDGTYIYVGGANGFMYSIAASTGAVGTSGRLASATGLGITSAPILDVSQSKMYVTVGADASTSCSGGPCAGVWQIATGAFTGGTGTENRQTAAGTTTPQYEGTFDAWHYGTGGTNGYFYACLTLGNTHLLRFSLASFATAPTSINVATGAKACSPVTEVLDGLTDYLYLSAVYAGDFNGTGTACATHGCVYNFRVGTGTSSTFSGSTTATAAFQFTGSATATTSGTSAVIVDYPGTSNYIYFTPNENGTPCATGDGCAVQVSQSALD